MRIQAPVRHGQETGLFTALLIEAVRQHGIQIFGSEIGQLRDRAEHIFAIGELKGQGPSRSSAPGTAAGALLDQPGERGVDWLAQCGERVQRDPQRGDTVTEVDRAAAGIHAVDNDLAQTAFTGSGGDQLTETGDSPHGSPFFQAGAFFHNGNDFIHETVESGHDGQAFQFRGTFTKSF